LKPEPGKQEPHFCGSKRPNRSGCCESQAINGRGDLTKCKTPDAAIGANDAAIRGDRNNYAANAPRIFFIAFASIWRMRSADTP
jgi:hypothetical protein